MIDTDITLPPNYIKLHLARSHAMILTSPPPLPDSSLTSQGWGCESDFCLTPPELSSGGICSLFQRVLDYFHLGVETPRLKGQRLLVEDIAKPIVESGAYAVLQAQPHFVLALHQKFSEPPRARARVGSADLLPR